MAITSDMAATMNGVLAGYMGPIKMKAAALHNISTNIYRYLKMIAVLVKED